MQRDRQAHDIMRFQHVIHEDNPDELQLFQAFIATQEAGVPVVISQ